MFEGTPQVLGPALSAPGSEKEKIYIYIYIYIHTHIYVYIYIYIYYPDWSPPQSAGTWRTRPRPWPGRHRCLYKPSSPSLLYMIVIMSLCTYRIRSWLSRNITKQTKLQNKPHICEPRPRPGRHRCRGAPISHYNNIV